MKTTKFFLILFVLSLSFFAKADEGMWIPILLEKYTIADMQKKGFKLTAEDIYSINKACLKDAVPIFGGGCTAGVISGQGLLITNHHCGYSQIQSHSSLDHDYLTDGFWAMKQSDELVCNGLKATFLVRMEDVTTKVLEGVSSGLSEDERNTIIALNSAKIVADATKDNHYEAAIRPFFNGNDFYLVVTEVFKDVRLVGAPPSAIGKFGGDTDNWVWPRHTGDFSIFRIYARKDNQPAEYSPDNVPYIPKKFLDISMKGVSETDFTMVLGYPGRTQEYISSFAVDFIQNKLNPVQIAIRQKVIDNMLAAMNTSPEIRIKYAAKHASVSNAWKKWQGESFGLAKVNTFKKKEQLENLFSTWLTLTSERINKYGKALGGLQFTYQMYTPYAIAYTYYTETAMNMDILNFIGGSLKIAKWKTGATEKEIAEIKERLKRHGNKFFKDYDQQTDKKIFSDAMNMYIDSVHLHEFRPFYFNVVEKKYKGNFLLFANDNYPKSVFTDQKRYNKFIEEYSEKTMQKLEKEALVQLYNSLTDLYKKTFEEKLFNFQNEIANYNRKYMQGLREMQTEKNFYPDANFTLRVAYGNIDEYKQRDGIKYMYYTTLDGIIEKDNPKIYDYCVPKKLKELYYAQDYGRYAENGSMRVCFIATNHTSGGNSGSPVLNAKGQMIGLNFDRCWEGTMSDIQYDINLCRNISLDIRYALFIIDKFAGAGYLLNEMNLVYN